MASILTTKVFRQTTSTHDNQAIYECDGLSKEVNAFLATLDPKIVRDVRYSGYALDNHRMMLSCAVVYEVIK